jgi:regulator of RNase E activity RraA
LWINPGDIIVADQDGVVVVPPSLVDLVAQLCLERKEMDGNIMEAIEQGEVMGDCMKKFKRSES